MTDLIEKGMGLLGLVVVADVVGKVLDKGKKKSKPLFKETKEKSIKW